MAQKASSRRTRRLVCAAAVMAAMAGGLIARADTLIDSFETGGMDEPGDANVTTTPLQTTGVTDGSFSLRVDIAAPANFWADTGHINADPTAVLANSVLKWDVLNTTDFLQIVPIFLTNTGSFYYQGSAVGVGPSANEQTMSFNYASLGLPTDATNIRIRFQYNSNPANNTTYYMDNVRVGGPPVTLGPGPSSWALNGSGDWTTASNWDPSSGPNSPPGASGSVITFDTHGGSITTASQIVINLGQPVSANTLTFNKGGGGYKLTGTAALNVAFSFNVASGNHIITVPVTIPDNVSFSVATGSSLTINNLTHSAFSGTNLISGGGTLSVPRLPNCNVDVEGGTVNLLPGNAQNDAFIYGLTLANGSTFNLNDATLRINSLSNGAGTNNVNIGAGGVLKVATYGGSAYFGNLTGAGNVIVGAIDDGDQSAPASTSTWGGTIAYTGTTQITHGNTLVITAPMTSSSSISLDSGSLLQVASGAAGFRPIKTASVTISDSSKIDLTDNRMILTNMAVGTWTGSNYDGVTGLVASGRNGGTWTGPGIVTSESAAVSPNIQTTLAVALASNVKGITGSQTAVWTGQTVHASDVLVMYTWGGDANLDGRLDADDYFRIDSNYNKSGTSFGYFDGDFNYDGVINGDDYFIIDSNFAAAQGNPFPTAAPFGSLSAVPEPASMAAIVAAGMLAGLMRRRKR